MIKIYCNPFEFIPFLETLASRHEKSIFKDSAHLANYSRKISNLEFSFHYY